LRKPVLRISRRSTISWRKLAAIHPRLRSVVEMKVFEGLSMEEIADRIQVAPRTVARNWTFCKGWLREQLSVE